MIPGATGLGDGAVAALPATRATLERYVSAATVLAEEAVTLVEVEGYQGQEEAARLLPMGAGLVPGTHAVMAVPWGSRAPGRSLTLRYSDRGWIGEPGDATRANVPYPDLLAGSVALDKTAAVLPEARPRQALGVARVEFRNLAGRFDGYDQSFAIAGRPLRLYRGPHEVRPRAAFADFSQLATLRSARWQIDRELAAIETEGTNLKLTVPVQGRRYLGTGGGEGPAEFAGRLMPEVLGTKAGVEPELVERANNLFRVRGGRFKSVLSLTDRGESLSNIGDYADEASLIAATLAGGEFATCTAEGLLRTGGLNSGYQLRATVEGALDSAGAFPSTHGEIALFALRELAGLEADEVDAASFAAWWPSGRAGWSAASTAAAGEGPSVEQLLEDLAASIVGWWGDGPRGRVRAYRLLAPVGSPAMVLGVGDLVADPRPLPPLEVPRKEQRATYRERASVATALVSAADDVTVLDLYQVGDVAADPTITRRWPTAGERLHRSLFYDKADADALALHIRSLFDGRAPLEVDIGRRGYLLDVGDEVRLTYPGLGLTGGRSCRVAGLRLRGADSTALLY